LTQLNRKAVSKDRSYRRLLKAHNAGAEVNSSKYEQQWWRRLNHRL